MLINEHFNIAKKNKLFKLDFKVINFELIQNAVTLSVYSLAAFKLNELIVK